MNQISVASGFTPRLLCLTAILVASAATLMTLPACQSGSGTKHHEPIPADYYAD